MPEAALTQLAAWLEQKHGQIMTLEQDAINCLNKQDISGYKEGMRRKAQLLASLATDAKPLLADLPEDVAEGISATIASFSASARTSLDLDSVFYMSALLYPDDHKRGEPDNLDIFIRKIKILKS